MISHVHSIKIYLYTRNTVIIRYPQQFIQIFLVIVYSSYCSIVFDSNSNKAPIGICHCNNGNCKVNRSNPS